MDGVSEKDRRTGGDSITESNHSKIDFEIIERETRENNNERIVVQFTLPYFDQGKNHSDLVRKYTFYGVKEEDLPYAIRHQLLEEAFSLLSDVQEQVRFQGPNSIRLVEKWCNIAKCMMRYEMHHKIDRGIEEDGENGHHKYLAHTSPLIC